MPSWLGSYQHALSLGALLFSSTVFRTANALNVTVPSIFPVDTPVQVSVGFDTYKQSHKWASFDTQYTAFSDIKPVCVNPPAEGCSYDELYEHYRLYLYTPEWMFTCYLTPILSVGNDTSPTITIPSNLGPKGEDYKIFAIEFNGDTMYMPEYGLASSNHFTLANSSIVAWTVWEHYGGWLKPYQDLPCSSYACYRACGLKWSDGVGNKAPGSSPMFFDCINQCPGMRVSYDDPTGPWSWYRFTADPTDDDENSTSSSASSAATSLGKTNSAGSRPTVSFPTSYRTPTILISSTYVQYPIDPDPTEVYGTPPPSLDYVSRPTTASRTYTTPTTASTTTSAANSTGPATGQAGRIMKPFHIVGQISLLVITTVTFFAWSL